MKKNISALLCLCIIFTAIPSYAQYNIAVGSNTASEISPTSADLSELSAISGEDIIPYTENFDKPTQTSTDIPLRADNYSIVHQSFDNQALESNRLATVDEAWQYEVSASLATSSEITDNNYRLNNLNAKDSFSLQNQSLRMNFSGSSVGNEYIDPMTGNLIITETDLILPGVDGLDLNLSRYYSLSQAEFYTKTSNLHIDPKIFTLDADGYVVTEQVRNNQTNEEYQYYYPYSSEDEAQARIAEITNRDNCNGLYTYNASYEQVDAGTHVPINYYYTSDITSSSYTTQRNNLGIGWSWSFPSVQTIKDNYSDADEIPKAIYYHDGKGGVMELERDNSGDYSFVNYVGNDISFELWGFNNSDICNTARIDYVVTISDGTTYYFGPHGEIRTISDIHGNKIIFSYTRKDFYGAENMPVISGITDTVGRYIDFEYSSDDSCEYIDISVSVPSEPNRSIDLKYTRAKIGVSKKTMDATGNEFNEYISDETILTSVTYPNGDTTRYFPASSDGEYDVAYPIEFTFADKYFESEYVLNTGGYGQNFVYLLGKIERVNSRSSYSYEICERNLGHGGVCEAYRVKERYDNLPVIDNVRSDPADDNMKYYDTVDTYLSNKVEYSYINDYTGYPYFISLGEADEGDLVSKTIQRAENSTLTYEYYMHDGSPLLKNNISVYNNPVGSKMTISESVESYEAKQPSYTKLTYSNDEGYSYDSYLYTEINVNHTKAYGKPLLQTEEMSYDVSVSENRIKHGISYTYDADTGFVLSKSRYNNTNTQCIERFTYTADNRISSYTDPLGNMDTYSYEYTNGKVSKVIKESYNGSERIVITKLYTADTGYSLPTEVTTTVTAGTSSRTQTASYTYDMLWGVVKTASDNDGNVTYYEYDSIGRNTRTIYPQYSAYSSADDKSTNIIAVESVNYYTVARGYDGVITDEQYLKILCSEKSIIYYDVTDMTIANPLSFDFSAAEETYSCYENEYVLGNGDTVAIEVAELADEDSVWLETLYYYDTDANTVTTVSPSGITTITQYDGAGRTVKITDEFGNQKITEYNKTGDGVGFNSSLYFIPASDTTSRQNITELNYDRQQNVTSEKTYINYPGTYIETKYAYDFAGNVIGIIDANGNVNEDGYTQVNTYDKLNRLVSAKNADNDIIRNTYDSMGNIVKQTITAKGGTEIPLFERSFDGEGKLIADKDNSGNSEGYTYDNMGRLVSITDKESNQYIMEYDALGNKIVTSIQNDDSMIINQSEFDTPYGASTVYNLIGEYNADESAYLMYMNEKRENVFSPTGRVLNQFSVYAYDTGVSGCSFTSDTRYKYDADGNVLSVTGGGAYGIYDEQNKLRRYTAGFSTHYSYDKGRLSNVQIDGSHLRNTSETVNVSYEFYDDGKLKSVSYPPFTDGSILKSEYTYDGLSRLISLVNRKGTTVISSYSYTYDNNGNILTVSENVGNVQHSTAYTYDKQNRITSVSGTKGADSYYEYDVRGNRKVSFEQIDFLSQSNAEYSYDVQGKMTHARVDNDETEFGYSSSGIRSMKKENSEYSEFYIYDANGRLMGISEPAMYRVNSDSYIIVTYPFKQYIWGPDRVLAQIDVKSNEVYYYLYNGHGDVVQITDDEGNVVNNYDYDVWGNFITKSETVDNPFTYFCQTYDETTGLYYLRARYYDPSTGRFTQQDPAEDGYNWYVYGGNNPVMFADENGMRPKAIADTIIRDNASYIIYAADYFGVNPGILGAAIYAEQRLNVNWVDDKFDAFIGFWGIVDMSIGISQVLLSTAKMLEDEGYMPQVKASDGGWNIPFIGTVSGTETMARTKALQNNFVNVMYAAAYLRYYQDRWENVYPKIDGDTAVLATLYNQGERYPPHANPKPSHFGIFARNNYYHVRKLLGLD